MGCVIHKSADDTYILTNAKFIAGNDQLIVHFDDKEEFAATSLVQNNQFAILCLGVQHLTSPCIRFHPGPVNYSEAMCIVPKPEVIKFQKFWGPIASPSCASRTNDGTILPDVHFQYICHHENTTLMTPAPVFHKDGRVNGFIVADCRKTTTAGKPATDHHVKLCLKAIELEAILQTMLRDINWKVFFFYNSFFL